MSGEKLSVIVDEQTIDPTELGTNVLKARGSFEDAVRAALGTTVSIKIDALTHQLQETYERVTAAIGALPKEHNHCSLQTVTFTLSISSSGEVSLLSALKGKVDGQTGLTFTIQRST